MVRHRRTESLAGCPQERERVEPHYVTFQYENRHPSAEVRRIRLCDAEYGNAHTFPTCDHANGAPNGIVRGVSAGYFRSPIPSTFVINSMQVSPVPDQFGKTFSHNW